MLLIIAIIVVVGVGFYWHKTQHEGSHNHPLGYSVPNVLPGVPDQDKNDEKKEPNVKVIVTYNDGTTESFMNEDGEVEYNDGGIIVIRPSDDRCITISPYAYRKVEEKEI